MVDISTDILADVQDGSLDMGAPEGTVPAQGADALQVNQAPDQQSTALPDDAAAKPASLRDQISTALKGEAETPPAALQDGKVRDPATGQFVAAPAVDPNAPPAANTQAGPVTVPYGFDPKHFTALPAEAQQYVAQTMEAVNNAAQRYSAFEQLIAPRYQAWALSGMTPESAINQLLALSDFAGRDPQGFIKYFTQQQNISLEDLAFGPDPVDPTVAALQGQIGQLQNQLQGMNVQQQQQQHSALINDVANEIEVKDASGGFKYPHMEELGDSIMPYIQVVRGERPQAGVPEVIQEAYTRACWSNPGVREKLQAAQATAQQTQQLAQSVETVRKAQKAGSSVPSGAPSGGTDQNANSTAGTLRDQIKASMAAHSPL